LTNNSQTGINGTTGTGGTFVFTVTGVYSILWRLHTTEAGQLTLGLNGVLLPETTTVDDNPTR
jgi:hypothetical protein